MVRGGTPSGADSVLAGRWDRLWGHRSRLVALARRRGGGDDAEDIAHEAILRAALFTRLDEERVDRFLSAVVTRLVVDRHRRLLRDQVWSRHPALAPNGSPVATHEEELCDRDEARWAAGLLAARLPSVLLEIVHSRASGVSWDDLALARGESSGALEARLAGRCVTSGGRSSRSEANRSCRFIRARRVIRVTGIASYLSGTPVSDRPVTFEADSDAKGSLVSRDSRTIR